MEVGPDCQRVGCLLLLALSLFLDMASPRSLESALLRPSSRDSPLMVEMGPGLAWPLCAHGVLMVCTRTGLCVVGEVWPSLE